ncbi:MAG: hypothetical protein ABIR92_00175 [Gemmatimonadaceae bacterium]
MHIARNFLSAGLFCLAVGCSRSDDTLPLTGDYSLTPASADGVTEKGMGELHAGMSVPRAEAIVRSTLGPPPGVDSAQCRMARWDGAPTGVSLMIDGGNVVRIDVDSGSVPTSAGARVGDPESRIQELYAGRVALGPHKYIAGGHYLTVRPANPADSAFRLIFETDGKQVIGYRAGRRPQVENVERCG